MGNRRQPLLFTGHLRQSRPEHEPLLAAPTEGRGAVWSRVGWRPVTQVQRPPADAQADLANPSALEPSGAPDRPSARTPPRPTSRADPAATDGAAPTKKTTTVKKTKAAEAGRSGALVLRSDSPPVDQLDFDDRHDTRATESEEMAQRYAGLRKDRRRNDWHYLAMGLVVFVVGAAVYLAGFVVVSRLLPHLSARLVSQIVGLACVAAGGGVAVRSAGRALKQRYARPRGRGL